MEAYLDQAATTKVSESVCNLMVQVMQKDYGNPSSMHKKGVEAERYITTAKEQIAQTLKVEEKEIVFTSGGTESNNQALIGGAFANRRRGNHIITTVVEHPSVKNTMAFLEEQGFCVTYLPVDKKGRIDLQELEDAIREDTILVSIMYVNNEIGTIQPIEEAAKRIHKKNADTLFHVDAIQAYGKYEIYPKRMGIDLLSVSGHKIHGPKGIGFLYIRDKVKIKPILYGGGQQMGMRSGTENVPAIAGIGLAAEEIYQKKNNQKEELANKKETFVQALSELEEVKINSPKTEEGAFHIVSASFLGVRSEVLLHALGEKGIYVSAGSACSSHKKTASPTLKGIGLSETEIESTLRFSFSYETTKEELDYTIEVLKEILPKLRKYRRH